MSNYRQIEMRVQAEPPTAPINPDPHVLESGRMSETEKASMQMVSIGMILDFVDWINKHHKIQLHTANVVSSLTEDEIIILVSKYFGINLIKLAQERNQILATVERINRHG